MAPLVMLSQGHQSDVEPIYVETFVRPSERVSGRRASFPYWRRSRGTLRICN